MTDEVTPFLCLGSVELANDARLAAYVNNIGVPNATFSRDCACYAYDEGYDTPLSDPAPWYEPTRPESADYLGFYADTIELLPVYEREVASGRVGGQLGPLTIGPRSIGVSGTLWASSCEGMAYGKRWIGEVLRGSPCSDSDCPSDDLTILPACPEMEGYDADRYFRSLVDVGVVSGPVFAQVSRLPQCSIQAVSFVLTSSKPWLLHPRTRVVNAQDSTAGLSAPLTTPEWMGDGTFAITIANVDTVNATDVVIEGRISLDGSCPVSGLGRSVPPSWSYTIPVILAGDSITIDGARRKAFYYDGSCKESSSLLPYVTRTGPWKWPDVGPCSTMCVTVSSADGETETTIDTYLREVG